MKIAADSPAVSFSDPKAPTIEDILLHQKNPLGSSYKALATRSYGTFRGKEAGRELMLPEISLMKPN